jgi:hypothetical protein
MGRKQTRTGKYIYLCVASLTVLFLFVLGCATLIDRDPQSPLVEQAKIWIGVLNVIEKSKQVDIEIEEMKKELSR